MFEPIKRYDIRAFLYTTPKRENISSAICNCFTTTNGTTTVGNHILHDCPDIKPFVNILLPIRDHYLLKETYVSSKISSKMTNVNGTIYFNGVVVLNKNVSPKFSLATRCSFSKKFAAAFVRNYGDLS